jgi:hypothetical protein
MGMQLPSELTGLLSMLGYDWPESDETKLWDLAGTWTGMAEQITGSVEQLNAAARKVIDNNQGGDIDAFLSEWEDGESVPQNLASVFNPSTIIGIGLTVAGGIVLALKIQVIVQLILLAIQIAQAIATAVVTFGASLAQIPIFKIISGIIIDQLIGFAIEAVLNG